MFNPLVTNLEKLKDSELESKISELTKNYHIAARSGQGGVCGQIVALLNMYQEEQAKRQKAAMDSLLKKQNKTLDDLINID